MDSAPTNERISVSAKNPAPKVVPAWYAEMIDPYFHKTQCEARLVLLAMMLPAR